MQGDETLRVVWLSSAVLCCMPHTHRRACGPCTHHSMPSAPVPALPCPRPLRTPRRRWPRARPALPLPLPACKYLNTPSARESNTSAFSWMACTCRGGASERETSAQIKEREALKARGTQGNASGLYGAGEGRLRLPHAQCPRGALSWRVAPSNRPRKSKRVQTRAAHTVASVWIVSWMLTFAEWVTCAHEMQGPGAPWAASERRAQAAPGKRRH